MYNIIDLTDIKESVDYYGLVFIQSYQKKLDSSRRPLNGELYCQGKTLKFKIWDSTIQQIFNTNDLAGKIALITGTGGSYNGVKDITINSIKFDHGFTDMSAFLKAVNVDEVFKEFSDFINTNLSPRGIQLVSELFQKEDLYQRFKTSWAAQKMHDAQIGGLMNHTLKMLKLAQTLISNDKRLEAYKDLLYIGIILHDIGKIFELDTLGNYVKNSFVGHRTLGVELVVRNKDTFLNLFDEEFYLHILEIITGHHGEYGDQPKTVWAYVIHLIDMLDSQTTGIMDKVEVNDISEYSGNKAVWVRDGFLTF